MHPMDIKAGSQSPGMPATDGTYPQRRTRIRGCMTEYQKQVDHLAELSKLPGFREHILERLRELEKEPGFSGITNEVFDRVRAEKAAHA